MNQAAIRSRAILFYGDERPDLLRECQRLRKHTFVDSLNWRLTTDGYREFDAFDTPYALHCALLLSDVVVGYFRAIRTDQPYLAQTVFPTLASLKPYPRRWDIWEISRFCVRPGRHQFLIAKINYALMFSFAADRDASSLVAVVDLAHERLLRAMSIKTRRFGRPKIVNTDSDCKPIVCVSGEIPLSLQSAETINGLNKHLEMVEILDESYVQRSQQIPA